MKNHLLTPIIADLLKSAKGYAKRATQITPAGNRFRTVSLKPILVKATLVVFSLFMVNAAFAKNRINTVTVNTQSITPIYGTATAGITYIITVQSGNAGGGGTAGEFIKITGLPAGATSDIPGAGLAITPNGGTQTLTFHVTTAINTPANAAGWTFTLTSTANNGGGDSGNGLLKITPKTLTITGGTITASDKPYDGSTAATVTATGVTFGGLIGADVVSISPTGTFTPDASASLTAKTVTIALTAGGSSANYTLTQPAPPVTAKINAVAITITATNQTKTYGQTLTNGSKTTGFTTSTGLVAGETPKITLNYGTTAPGTAAIGTYTGAAVASAPASTNGTFNPANYIITYVAGDVIINPAVLTITPTPLTRVYGAANPAFTPSYVGFVNGQTSAIVTTPPTFATTATGTSPVGTPVPVTGSGAALSDPNYTISYAASNLSITRATLTITPNNVTKLVGTALTSGPGYTNYAAPAGLQNGETVSSVTVTYVNPFGNRVGDGIGFYNNSITLSAPVGPGTFLASNYTLSTTPADMTVVAATYDWTGAAGTDWKTAGNWNLLGVPSTTFYPGQSSANDIVRIGVGTAFTNQPEITATVPNSIASLTFGNTTAPILTTDLGTTLTIATLNINASTTVTITDNGTVTVNTDYNDLGTSVLNINGSKSFTITPSGNDVTIIGTLNQQGTGTMNLTSGNGNNININATGSVKQDAAATGTVTLLSGASITINGTLMQSGAGAFTVTDNGNLASTLTISTTGVVTQNSAVASTLSLITTNGITLQNNGHINLQGTGNLTMNANGYMASQGTISQSGSGTMTFTAGTGLIGGIFGIVGFYNNNAITQTGSGAMIFNSAFHNDNYPNPTPVPSLIQSAAGGSITFNSTFDNGGLVIPFIGTFNGGPITFGDAPSTVTFKNNFTLTTGSVTFGTGLATFNTPSTVTSIITIPRNATLTLVNTLFMNAVTHAFNTNAGTGALASYIIRSDGVMTLNSTTTCNFTNALSLTLNSDATGSATIAELASTTQIAGLTGKAIVQRFIKGSADVGDLSKRGYRLITSTVYNTAGVGGSNVYDLKYLQSTNLSGFGLAANGFNMTTTTNPTIYLFREDDPPPPALTTLFTTGYNWKGVAKINNIPAYLIGTQFKATQANLLDTTVTIPVGNGILYFFRGGGLVDNYSAPFAAPANATLSETGTLNMGSVPVKIWYAGSVAGLGTNLSYTVDPAHTAAPAGSLTSGFNLVGNPYPSTINWEKYQPGGANGNVTGNTIYVFNPFNKQYEAYQQVNNGDLTSEFTSADTLGNAIGSASNFIASGQGFFVQATALGQNLTFTENLKISAQPTVSNFNKLMGKPKATVAALVPFLHLKMVKDSLNFDEVIIRFKANSSANYVRGEDAVDMGGSDASESLSVFSADSIKLAISAMPLPGLTPSIVHLFTGSPTAGTYTLNVTALKNLPGLYKVWLKDGFTKDSVDLRKTTTYAFTIDKSNAATFGANRFTVVFSQDTANAYRLLHFDAQKTANEQKVQTTWTTKNEQNYTNFTVERSTDDGQSFNVVGGMPGTGAGLYSLVDKNPSKGNNVYRLKQEDINNVITYSNLVEVFFGNKNDRIHLYPNPAVNVINVDVRERWHDRDRYEIIVTNSAGTIVKHGTSGDSQWQAGISNLRPGTYLVSVLSKGDKNLVGQAKFVKL